MRTKLREGGSRATADLWSKGRKVAWESPPWVMGKLLELWEWWESGFSARDGREIGLCNHPFRGKLGSKCGNMANNARKTEEIWENAAFWDLDD